MENKNVGYLVMGIAVVSVNIANSDCAGSDAKSCTSCGNSCTAGNNCGLLTCGAVNEGACSCGKAAG